MFDLDEFSSVLEQDFQRSNMFSMVFATTPSSRSEEILSGVAGFLFTNINGAGTTDPFLSQGDISQLVNSRVAVQGTQYLLRKSTLGKYLIGALSNRTVQSFFGQFDTGEALLEFFNQGNTQTGLTVQSVKIPDNRLNYEMDKYHSAPSIKIMGREFEPLVVTFRMDAGALNYRAMMDWVNSVEDPVTGLRSLPEDVECNIQINLHDSRGIPHTTNIFDGAVPISVSSPTMSYEANNEITVFDVTFAYRVHHIGPVNENAIIDWLTGTLLPKAGAAAGKQVKELTNKDWNNFL